MENKRSEPFLLLAALFSAAVLAGLFFISPVSGRILDGFKNHLPLMEKYYYPTPTPTPTPIPEVRVLDTHTTYTHDGDVHVVGEVLNLTHGDATNISIPLRLLDASNKPVATTTAYVVLNDLPDRKQTCFEAAFVGTSAKWAKYDFQKAGFAAMASNTPRLTLYNLTGNYKAADATYTVSGAIRNDDTGAVFMVGAVATLYNKDGDVVGCMHKYIDGSSTTLYTGSYNNTGVFTITFDERDYKDVSTFRVDLDGTK